MIKNPKGQRVNTYLYKMERAGMPTRYNVARQSIDEAIALSFTLEEFKAELILSINKRQHAMHNVPFVNSSLSDTYA